MKNETNNYNKNILREIYKDIKKQGMYYRRRNINNDNPILQNTCRLCPQKLKDNRLYNNQLIKSSHLLTPISKKQFKKNSSNILTENNIEELDYQKNNRMRLKNRYSLRESMEIKSKIIKVEGLRKYPRKHTISEIQRLLSPQLESRNYFINSNDNSKKKIFQSKNYNKLNNYYLNTFNRIFNYDHINNVSVKNNYLYKPEKFRKKVKDNINDLFKNQEKYKSREENITEKPTNLSYRELCSFSKLNLYQRSFEN